MYEVAQIIVKLVLIAAALFVAGIVSVRVWRSDLDLRELFSPKRALSRAIDPHVSWLPIRDPVTIYQDGRAVAKVEDAQLEPTASKLVFTEINRSGELDLGREFEFQKWRLRFLGADTIISLDTSRPDKGRILQTAVCQIIGIRSPF
jgi:hypothetical protein